MFIYFIFFADLLKEDLLIMTNKLTRPRAVSNPFWNPFPFSVDNLRYILQMSILKCLFENMQMGMSWNRVEKCSFNIILNFSLCAPLNQVASVVRKLQLSLIVM